jgi:hypothetical protein
MDLQSVVPIFLVLAIAFSWIRFAQIFRSETGLAVVAGPIGMIASAVCVSGLGLALVDNGPLPGLLISVLGFLIAQATRLVGTGLMVVLAVLSLAGYLEFRAATIHVVLAAFS